MDPYRFEFTVSVPCDERFAETVRLLAVRAARYAGVAEATCEAFGSAIDQSVRERMGAAPGAPVSVVMRRAGGPLQVLVDGRPLTLEP